MDLKIWPASSSGSDINDMTVADGTCHSNIFCCNEGPALSSDVNPHIKCFYQTGKVSGVENMAGLIINI